MKANIFDEIKSLFKSKARMRGLFKDFHIQDIERIIGRLSSIVDEKKEMILEQQEKLKAKQSSIDSIRKQMMESGVSLKDLGGVESGGRKKSRLQRYMFEWGPDPKDDVWVGTMKGRAPKRFQEYLNRTNKKRMDCIKKEVHD